MVAPIDFQEADRLIKEFTPEIDYNTYKEYLQWDHPEHKPESLDAASDVLESKFFEWHERFIIPIEDRLHVYVSEEIAGHTDVDDGKLMIGWRSATDIGPFGVEVKVDRDSSIINASLKFRGEKLGTSYDFYHENRSLMIKSIIMHNLLDVLNEDSILKQHIKKWFSDAAEAPKYEPAIYKPGPQELPEGTVYLPPFVPMSMSTANDILKSLLDYDFLSLAEVEQIKSQLATEGKITDQSLASKFIDARGQLRRKREEPQYSFEGLYSHILDKLVKVANKLDQAGLFAEADEIDKILKGLDI
jgi:hypothetical protein